MRDRRWLVIFGAVLAAGACGSSSSTRDGGGAGTSGNGSAGMAGAGIGGAGGQGGGGTVANCALSQPFETSVQVVPSTSMSSEDSATVGADGLTAIVSIRPNHNINSHHFSLYSRSTLAGTFGNPQDLPGQIAAWSGTEPRLTRDGLNLFFDSSTPSRTTIEVASRASAPGDFGPPSDLQATIDSPTESAHGPWINSDNSRFYFELGYVLYVSTITGDQFEAPVAVTELNAGGTVLDPVLTNDELTIYFASERQVDPTVPPSYFRLWTSSRSSIGSSWGAPSYVSELDNGDDMVPTDVSPDGCILYVVDTDGQSIGRVKQAAKPSR